MAIKLSAISWLLVALVQLHFLVAICGAQAGDEAEKRTTFYNLNDGDTVKLIELYDEIVKQGGNPRELLESGLAKLRGEKQTSDGAKVQANSTPKPSAEQQQQQINPDSQHKDSKASREAAEQVVQMGTNESTGAPEANKSSSTLPKPQALTGHEEPEAGSSQVAAGKLDTVDQVDKKPADDKQAQESPPALVHAQVAGDKPLDSNSSSTTTTRSASLFDDATRLLSDQTTGLKNLYQLNKELAGLQSSSGRQAQAPSVANLLPSVGAHKAPVAAAGSESSSSSVLVPHNIRFEDQFVDMSDPNDPKLVQVKDESRAEVGPNGFRQESHESRVSTSIGDHPNSGDGASHHQSTSSSSFSSSSSSSSSSSISSISDADGTMTTITHDAPLEQAESQGLYVPKRRQPTSGQFQQFAGHNQHNSNWPIPFNEIRFDRQHSFPMAMPQMPLMPMQPLQPLPPLPPMRHTFGGSPSIGWPTSSFNGFPTMSPSSSSAFAQANGGPAAGAFANLFSGHHRQQLQHHHQEPGLFDTEQMETTN